MTRLSFILFLLTVSVGYSQDKSGNCNCKENLAYLIKNIESNYVGFEAKTRRIGAKKYEIMKDSLLHKAGQQMDYSCYSILWNYLSIFSDPHMGIAFIPQTDEARSMVREIFSKFKTIPVNEYNIKEYLRSKVSLDSIEGIWKDRPTGQVMAVYKDTFSSNRFLGVILEADNLFWYKGQVKMVLKKIGNAYQAEYYRQDHKFSKNNCLLKDGHLSITGFSTWDRIYPGKAMPDKKMIDFNILSPKVAVIKMLSSDIHYKPLLDSIVGKLEKNNLETLIIDLRDNYGGHIMTYDTLMPLLYTNPYYYDGLYVKSSDENIQKYREMAKNDALAPEDQAALNAVADSMEVYKNKYFKFSDGDTVRFPGLKKYPRKVIIVINEGSRSAAELFTLYAKKSSKVIVAGTNSRGMLDYTEAGSPRQLPCKSIFFLCPMGSGEHKTLPYIDNIGISPDIRLDYTINDWVDYLHNHFLKKKLAEQIKAYFQ